MSLQLKQISEVEWEIPQTGNMQVPTRIFASKKMLEQMQQDRTLQQGRNLTMLPGIYKYGIILPDGHEGYGFPIGGVAGLSTENGGISPGGIGYDINCLSKDTKIMIDYGCYKKIQDIEQNFFEIQTTHSPYILKSQLFQTRVCSFNKNSRDFDDKEIVYFMKRKYKGYILEIKTHTGFSIKVTEDHKLLTNNGMVAAKNLSPHHHVAIYPFEGVEQSEVDSNTEILKETIFTNSIQKELKKRGLIPLNYDNIQLPILTKLFGYLLGDGCIFFSKGKGNIHAYGTNEDLQEIQKDIHKLGYSANIYHRIRNHSITNQYGEKKFTTETHELHVSSTSLAQLFIELGYPLGAKTKTNYSVPQWIMGGTLWLKRLFLSGLFGAELSWPAKQTKTCFYSPTFSMNKNEYMIVNARYFCVQLIKLLEEFSVNVNKIHVRQEFKNKSGKTSRVLIQISNETENLIRFWSTIGFSYNKKRSLLSQIGIVYLKEKLLVTEQRKNIQKKIKEYKQKGLTFQEVKEVVKAENCNDRFIKRHYYESAGQRIPLDFISINEFIQDKKREMKRYGFLIDKIQLIKKESYDDYVYDLNIIETHNFVADNIIVSNCGVRLLQTNIEKKQVFPKINQLLDALVANVPAGLGSSNLRSSKKQLDEVLNHGVQWALDNGYGEAHDVECCEESGCMQTAEASAVSEKAKQRGMKQLATLGAGNHFLEVQYVDEIFDVHAANTFGITHAGQVCVMIHCGSRGLGHQVCSDYLRLMEQTFPDIVKQLPDKELIYAPVGHRLCMQYFQAMSASANFAWCNRHIIGHQVRHAFKRVFPSCKLTTVYDIAHNIAKKETHDIDGHKQEVFVHRKGATRAFGAGNKEVPLQYRSVGQPVIIPGSMGTASYVLVGTQQSMDKTFGSAPHGAGRLMSRHAANRLFRAERVQRELEQRNIVVHAASWKGIAEEAPGVYKDIDEVVEVAHKAGIGSKVACLRPLGVIKG